MDTFMACPADDHPNPATWTHVNTTTATPYGLAIGASPPFPICAPMIHAIATWAMIICTPPTMNSTLRPYDGAHQRRVAAEPDGAEHQRREEGQHDHASQLEEHGHGHGEHQVRPVLAPRRHPPERAVLALSRHLNGLHNVLELRVHVRVRPAHADQRGAGVVRPAAHHEAAGGVGEEEGAQEDDHGRRAGEAQGEAPAPGDARGGVVDEVGGQYADTEEELEAGGEGAAPLRRGHLGEEQRSGLSFQTYSYEICRFRLFKQIKFKTSQFSNSKVQLSLSQSFKQSI
jgi:hypothetical protein